MDASNKSETQDYWIKNIRETAAYDIFDHAVYFRFDVATKDIQIGWDIPIYLSNKATTVDKEEFEEVRARAYKCIRHWMKEQGIDKSELIPLPYPHGYKKPKYIEPD
jgi:reverse gyrase